ncbi:MAG: MMPL family transporter [Acidimicrobiia bacterium]
MSFGTESLARASSARPWRTIGVWAVLLVAAGVLSSRLLGDALTTDITFTDDPDSVLALEWAEELRGSQPDTEFVVVLSATMTVEDSGYAAFVGRIQDEVGGITGVAAVGSFLTDDGPVSESMQAALLPVRIAGEDFDAAGLIAEQVRETVAVIEAPDGFEAHVAGPATLNNDFNHIAEEDLRTGETIGVGVALVVLVVVFGTVVSAVIPIILGVMAIAVALGLAALVGQVMDLSFFITNMITMIGLAVGIDYSLFIVSRFREERAHGHDVRSAIERTGATAGRAVFFSGMTVVLALVGLLIVPNSLFHALGIGAILVVVAAVAASMTLLPAVLAVMGDRVNALRVRRTAALEHQGRYWDRITRTVMARPVISLLLSATILTLAAASFFSIETGLAGVSSLPDEIASKRAFDILDSEFSGGITSPVLIVARGDDALRMIGEMEGLLSGDDRFGPVEVDPASTEVFALATLALPDDVTSNASKEAIQYLRSEAVPAVLSGADGTEVVVGGETAIIVDLVAQTQDYTPIVFLVVLGLSFILLTLAFRSIVIPAKAIAMNLLSVGAAYGLVAMFFQVGVGPEWVKGIASFLGFTQVETIEAWLPLLLFSVLFGLSMDYHVFLLSRIKERFDQTGDNTESVAYGLRTTGALITGAAAIMVAVFSGFAAGQLVALQQMGFGLAVAVLLDATIIRTILVPASMRLLGHRNWYLPSWLDWLPNIAVDGRIHARPAATEPEVTVG